MLNLFLDRARRRRVWQRLVPLVAAPVHQDAHEGHEHSDLRQALMRLSARQRACVVLHYYLDLPMYLRDEVIVGGGLMLNQPGDLTPQAMNLVGSGFDVAPGRPVTEDLGRRNKLCPGLTWPQIWSQPQRYEVVLIQGPVLPRPEVGPSHVALDIPTLGYWPLTVSRAHLQP